MDALVLASRLALVLVYTDTSTASRLHHIPLCPCHKVPSIAQFILSLHFFSYIKFLYSLKLSSFVSILLLLLSCHDFTTQNHTKSLFNVSNTCSVYQTMFRTVKYQLLVTSFHLQVLVYELTLAAIWTISDIKYMYYMKQLKWWN